jgi:hypothetical protein
MCHYPRLSNANFNPLIFDREVEYHELRLALERILALYKNPW